MKETCGLAILLLMVFLSGCRPFKSSKHTGQVYLQKHDLAKLNGFYRNIADDTGQHYSLWQTNDLVRYYLDNEIKDTQNNSIQLLALNRKKLLCTRWKDSTAIAEKKIKGHIRKGFFVAKGRERFRGVPPFLWNDMHSKYRLTLDTNNCLVVDGVYSSNAGFLFFVGGLRIPYYLRFGRRQ